MTLILTLGGIQIGLLQIARKVLWTPSPSSLVNPVAVPPTSYELPLPLPPPTLEEESTHMGVALQQPTPPLLPLSELRCIS